MKKLFSKRTVVSFCLILLALFLVRPQAGRLRDRVSQSISAALGRRVEIGALHLRFLPRPGFELENLVIRDDAAFGAEPLLRSPDVTAWLRVKSLLRGRIEIASLDLSEASLNLTRNQQGEWNLEDLIERTARVTTAPTASPRGQSRPEFPYIEAEGARINFKIGAEKTHYALTDAQFALWQESENSWGMRLKARPIRTDANLTDTGLIRINGLWQRSPVLHQTPLQFSFEWEQAQIGQVSKLIYGRDTGWRGNVLISGTLAGTPADLKVATESSIDDFRRYDVFAGGDLPLDVHCAAEYSSIRKTLSDLDCNAPVGNGSLELKGSASNLPLSSSSYSLSLVASKVPAQAVVNLLRHAKTSIPKDTAADGALNANLLVSRGGFAQPVQWKGEGEIQDLALNSGSTASELQLGTVPFSLVPGSSVPGSSKTKVDAVLENAARVEIGPINVALGRPTPLQAHISLSRTGYRASIRGDAGIKRLLQSAHTLGIPGPALAADGNSTVDLAIGGTWGGTQWPLVMGTAQLRSVRAQVRGLNTPLQISNANLVLDEHLVRVQNLNASAAGAIWRGTLELPRPCIAPDVCGLQFNLRAANVSATALNAMLNPLAVKHPWYRLLARNSPQTPYLLRARASGRIAIDRLVLGKSVCNQFTAELGLEKGKVTLGNIRGEILDGRVNGEWKADFAARPPAYSGTGGFDGVSLFQIADLTHDSWIDGKGTASYKFKASGWRFQDLLDSADLSATFTIKDSNFPHIVLTSTSAPLHASMFSGTVFLRDGNFSFQDTKLDTATGVYKVSGTASLTGALNLKMNGETANGYSLSGTLVKTRVSQITPSATQALLKP